MAKDLGDAIGVALGRSAREVVQTVSQNARRAKKGPLSGGRGVAAGVGLAALAPVVTKGAGKLVRTFNNGAGALDKLNDPAGMAKEAGKSMVPGMGGKSSGIDAVGNGRRMPIQQSMDVAVPVQVAYDAWTQFEDWPSFMHRLDRVAQEDNSHVSFKTKIWGISKEFQAEIIEQRPDERIKWRVTDGVSHTGVVTFHELAPRLTRINVDIIVAPGSLIEKAGRGLRHAKRAVRADMHRFKAHVELEEDAGGSWRGEIDDGKVKRKRAAASSRSGSSRSSGSSSRSSSRSTKRASSPSGNRSRSRSSGSGSGSSGSSRSGSSSNGASASRKSSGSGSGSRKKSASRS